MRLRPRFDIPFARDGSVRFLPWLIALMVYLAGLALAGTLLLNGSLVDWSRSTAAIATVELPPAEDKTADAENAAVLDLLRHTPGIVAAEPMPREAVAKLVEPWLGGAVATDQLALPRLVDVKLDPAHPPDLAALRRHLSELAPMATLDEARHAFDRLFDLGLSIEVTAIAIVILIGLAAMMTVILSTRAGLAVHRNVIEVLHILGAQDRYIARQFGRQALSLGLRGGIIGFVLAVLTLLAISHIAATASLLGPEVRLAPALSLRIWHWAALALLPLAAAIIARYTALATVSRALSRLP